MQFQITTRRVAAFIMLASAAMAAACSNSGVTAPGQTLQSAHRVSADDDPNTCKSGWTEIDGHIYCNP
jgi:hypothetical protein